MLSVVASQVVMQRKIAKDTKEQWSMLARDSGNQTGRRVKAADECREPFLEERSQISVRDGDAGTTC